ncbi:MAG: hypothetical protein QOH73_872, partial [Gaiellaceae bacterium]|nr:hypothetical protein [Gaiellaceae bacterium]
MRPLPRLLAFLTLVLALAGCGTGAKATTPAAPPPSSPAATACGKEVGRQDLAALLLQAKRAYGAQKRAFPKPGTPAY